MRPPPEHLYPTDPWRVRETRDSERYFARAETAFSLSNGYVGIRGTFDEGRPTAVARRRAAARDLWAWDVEITDEDGRICSLSSVLIAGRPMGVR